MLNFSLFFHLCCATTYVDNVGEIKLYINVRHLTLTHYVVLFPQNGNRIVTIDSVTSLYSVYRKPLLGVASTTRTF